MALKCFMIMSLLLLSVGCKGRTTDPLDVSYRKLRAVPQEKWDALAQKKIFFGHQSVGRNIIEGLEKVLKSVPEIRLEIRETADPRDFQGPVFAHARIGQNREPEGKIDHFRQILESGIGQTADVAFFKLCYVDIDRSTKIVDLVAHYDETLEDLARKYPDLVILPVTEPLTNVTPGIKAKIKRVLGMGPALKPDNVKRNAFNDHIRRKYGTAIWDLADAEASTPEGTKVFFRNSQGTHFLLNRDYTMDGGHLNEVGSQVIAIDLLLRLASLDLD
jgi:hypothetical protein